MTYPAQYYRNSKKWHELIGKTGTVLYATRLEVTAKEFEIFLPYSFLLVELDEVNSTGVKKKGVKRKIEVMGEARTEFRSGEKIILELRKIAQPDETGIISYAVKACKISTNSKIA